MLKDLKQRKKLKGKLKNCYNGNYKTNNEVWRYVNTPLQIL